MGWVDSHCHLDFEAFKQTSLWTDLEQDFENVLVPATQFRYFDRVIALRHSYPDLVKIALGLHPYFISEHSQQDIERLQAAIMRHQPAALGEFGLDFMLGEDTFERQFYYFNQQLTLAKQFQLPLVIHCRKAHDRLASEVKTSGFSQGGFIHGFSGSLQQAKRYLDLGFVLGLGGALTYERAKAMHKMVAALPDDGYVLETDSPDMAPAFARNEVNTPLNIPRIAQHIAQLRHQTVDDVMQNSTSNYYRILQINRTS